MCQIHTRGRVGGLSLSGRSLALKFCTFKLCRRCLVIITIIDTTTFWFLIFIDKVHILWSARWRERPLSVFYSIIVSAISLSRSPQKVIALSCISSYNLSVDNISKDAIVNCSPERGLAMSLMLCMLFWSRMYELLIASQSNGIVSPFSVSESAKECWTW